MPKGDLSFLSMDEDGTYGISTLHFLKRLMEVLDPDTPPKPCEYFDLIGGTSTGRFVQTRFIYCKCLISTVY